MGKRSRYKKSADDTKIYGVKVILDDPTDPDPDGPRKIYYFRSRKARRAQSRLNGQRWRDLSEHERLQL